MKSMALVLAALFASSPSGCNKINENLNRGLQEQKSYTRAAMEKYRKDPKVFQGSSPGVLEIWSRADYVATAVAKHNVPGDWASTTDKLNFLEPRIQFDTGGKPFCVIQQSNNIFVLRVLSEPVNCSLQLLASIDTTNIRSGDMEFYHRSDYWIYILRLPAE